MGEDSDERRWMAVLNGEDAAFAVVWDRHFNVLVRHVLRLSDSNSEAEDVAAMALLEAWRKRERVRFVDGSLRPWLVVTATNLHRNRSRASRRYGQVLERVPPPERMTDPADEAIDRASARAVRQSLKELPPGDQSLITLIVFEGMSVSDAAAATGLKESAARMRWARLKRRLRAQDQWQQLAERVMS